jgi:ABC-type multidrug transport system permease subunit
MRAARFSLARVWAVARKDLLELAREPQMLLLSLLTPLFFMVISALGYAGTLKPATYAILVDDPGQAAPALVQRLEQARYPDGRPAFQLLPAGGTPAEVDAALKQGAAAALVRFGRDEQGGLVFTLRGDGAALRYTLASQELDRWLGAELDALAGRPRPVRTETLPLNPYAPLNDFDAYAAGMFTFAILLLIPQTAMLVGREVRWGTLRRLQLSLLSPLELFCGITLAQLGIAVVQVGLLFFTALAFGFNNHGSLGLAIGIGLLMSFGAIGMGLVTAGLVKSDTDALNIGSVFSMVQVFLSGSFFALPAPALFVLGGHTVRLFDFIPATNALMALNLVLTGGAGLSEVAFRLLLAGLLSLIYFGLSIWVFTRLQMRAN